LTWVNISDQLKLFAASAICGALLSVFYDVIRMSRILCGITNSRLRVPDGKNIILPLLPQPQNKPKRKRRVKGFADVFVFVGDVLFFIAAALALMPVFHNYGNGKVRIGGVFVAAVGWLVCHYTVGTVIITVFGAVRLCMTVALRYVAFIIMLPVRKLLIPVLEYIKKLLRIWAGKFSDVCRRIYLRLYTVYITKGLLRSARKGKPFGFLKTGGKSTEVKGEIKAKRNGTGN